MNKKILVSLPILLLISVEHTQAVRRDGGHARIEQEFSELQRQVGIAPQAYTGPSQLEFNKIRAELNNLLSEVTIDEAKINKKIDELEAKKPKRWPQPDDYRAVLKARLEGKEVKPRAAAEPTARRAGRPMSDEMQRHRGIQKEFTDIQIKAKMEVTPEAEIGKIRGRGPQGGKGQKEYNDIRAELNMLLAKDMLTDSDKKNINELISKLEKLNAARWPRPEDYKALLKAKS